MKDVVLLTGATGYLGHYLGDEAGRRGMRVVTAGREGADTPLDLRRPDTFSEVLDLVKPRYVLNAGAISSMAACQSQPTVAFAVNGKGPRALARACRCRFLQVSTDLVFAGDQAPYPATSTTRPLSVYGMSKADGEGVVADDWVVVRVPLLFGKSFDGTRGATDMLRRGVAAKEKLTLFTDEFRTPLHVADAAGAMLDLLLDPGVRGIRHLGGHERVSRWEFARRFCTAIGLPEETFEPGFSEDPRRPKDVSLVGDWEPVRGLDAALAVS